MFQHARVEEATGLRIYFADPHYPGSEAPTRTPMELRQYFPKGSDLHHWTTSSSTKWPRNSTTDPKDARRPHATSTHETITPQEPTKPIRIDQ